MKNIRPRHGIGRFRQMEGLGSVRARNMRALQICGGLRRFRHFACAVVDITREIQSLLPLHTDYAI